MTSLTPLAAGLLFLTAMPVGQFEGESVAKQVCGLRTPLVQALLEMYGEHQTEVTVIDDNRVAELFRNTDTGTWTIMITYTAGTSCLIDSGRDGVRS